MTTVCHWSFLALLYKASTTFPISWINSSVFSYVLSTGVSSNTTNTPEPWSRIPVQKEREQKVWNYVQTKTELSRNFYRQRYDSFATFGTLKSIRATAWLHNNDRKIFIKKAEIRASETLRPKIPRRAPVEKWQGDYQGSNTIIGLQHIINYATFEKRG